jgi:hypothetical protein
MEDVYREKRPFFLDISFFLLGLLIRRMRGPATPLFSFILPFSRFERHGEES